MSDTADQGTSPRSGRGLSGLVVADRRAGIRIPLRPPVVLAGMVPPPEVMRRLPTGTALYIAMMSRGHEGPSYRLGKTLATMRRRLEELWTRYRQ